MGQTEVEAPPAVGETIESLSQTLAARRDKLAALRAERQARQQASADEVRKNQLRAEIAQLDAEIAAEESQSVIQEEQDLDVVASGPSEPVVLVDETVPDTETTLEQPPVPGDTDGSEN